MARQKTVSPPLAKRITTWSKAMNCNTDSKDCVGDGNDAGGAGAVPPTVFMLPRNYVETDDDDGSELTCNDGPTSSTGVYFDNIEICATVHPLQETGVCWGEESTKPVIGRCVGFEPVKNAGAEDGCFVVECPSKPPLIGRPLGPAPLLARGVKGPRQAIPSVVKESNLVGCKRVACNSNEEIEAPHPKKRVLCCRDYRLSEDEKLFVEVAASLSGHDKPSFETEEAHFDDEVSSTKSTYSKGSFVVSARSSFYVSPMSSCAPSFQNSCALPPPPFVLPSLSTGALNRAKAA